MLRFNLKSQWDFNYNSAFYPFLFPWVSASRDMTGSLCSGFWKIVLYLPFLISIWPSILNQCFLLSLAKQCSMLLSCNFSCLSGQCRFIGFYSHHSLHCWKKFLHFQPSDVTEPVQMLFRPAFPIYVAVHIPCWQGNKIC